MYKKIFFKYLFIFCFIFIFLFILIFKTNFGLRFVLKIPSLFNNPINVSNLKGNIFDGFSGENWDIKFNNYTFHIDFINLKDGLKYEKGIFKVKNIILNNINVQYNFSHDKGEKVKFPAGIGLPFYIEIENINFNLLTFGVQQEILFEYADIYYTFKNDQHDLFIKEMTTSWGNIQGSLNIVNDNNYPINGNFQILPLSQQLKSSFFNKKYSFNEDIINGYLYLSGDLKELIINLHINGIDLVLDSNMLISFYEDDLNKIKRITFYANKLNPKTFVNSAPIADLSFQFILLPSDNKEYLDGSFYLENSKINYLNRSGIPIKNIDSKFFINNNQIVIPILNITLLKNGKLNIKGKIDNSDKKIYFNSKSKIAFNDFLTYDFPEIYEGDILIGGSLNRILLKLDLYSDISRIKGKIVFKTNKLNQMNLFINELALSYFQDSFLDISGKIGLIDSTDINLNILCKNINPANISHNFYIGSVNGSINIIGNYLNNVFTNINIKDSKLSNNIFKINGDIVLNNKILKEANLKAVLGDNKLDINGNFGKKNDKLSFNINAPKLSQIGSGFTGYFDTKGFISGTLDNFVINLLGNVKNVWYKNILELNSLNYNVNLSSQLDDVLRINIQGNGLKFKDYIAKKINLLSSGSLRKNSFFTDSDISINNKKYLIKIDSLGGFNDNYYWNGKFSKFDISGNLDLKLQSMVYVFLSYDEIKITPATWSFMGGKLDLESFSWERGKFLISKGNAKNINLYYLNKFFKIPFEQNLSINSKWDFVYGDNAKGSLNINRTSGDINFPKSKKKMGLSQLDLNMYFNNNNIKSVLTTKSNYFSVNSNLNIFAIFDNFKRSTIEGNIDVDLSDVRRLNFLFPISTIIGGSLKSNIGVDGSLANIMLSGDIKAKDVVYHNLDSGLFLKNGILDAYFDKKRIVVRNLEFNSYDGKIYAQGNLGSSNNNNLDIYLDIFAKRYILYNRPDRKAVLTGKAKLQYNNILGFSLVGDIKLDESNFSFPKSSMPALSDDVVIVGSNSDVINKRVPLNFDINIDLNDNFKFSGKGLSVIMGGDLHFISNPKYNMNLIGNVNVIDGSYKFYGQHLKIYNGKLIFSGPILNPNINLKALRENSPVGAGVKVIGTLNKPTVELIANQPMNDTDKLSWLVLGRASSGESDDQALAASMGMLVAGGINERIGLLHDISVGGRQTRNTGTGELNPAEQIITIGRNITKKIYLGYEYGLTSTSQAAKIIYQISKSIQLITRAGTDSISGEARYSIRFD